MSTDSTSSESINGPFSVPLPTGVSPTHGPEPAPAPPDPPANGDVTEEFEHGLGSTIAWLLVLSLVQKAIGFVRSLVICRWLDPVNLGAWGMSLAVMETLLPLSLLSIPGCFGRYVEHFRQRGQLRGFVRQAGLLCGVSLGSAVFIALLFQGHLATLCFGSSDYRSIFVFAVVCTVPSAVFGFCGELLVALRLGKSATLGTFCRGVTFTFITIGLLLWWRTDVVAMITAFGVSYLLAIAVVLRPTASALLQAPPDRSPLPLTRTWSGLSRFVIAFWLMDLLTNLFFTVDRYMLVNFSPNQANALEQVGNYESAHTIPILIATIVLMISRLILPYQVREWESGNQQQVWRNTNLSIKITGLTLFLVGWALSFAGGPIFHVWFRGQYEAGLQVMPLAIAICCLTGVAAMWMNYFLCIEKAWLGTVTTGLAVAVNIAVNLVLVPRYGLMGAATATLIANGTVIGTSIVVGHYHHLRFEPATAVLACLPAAVCTPPPVAAGLLVAIVALMACGYLLNRDERRILTELVQAGLARIQRPQDA